MIPRLPRRFLATVSFALVACSAGAEDGGELWLRYRNVEDPALLRNYRDAIREICVQGQSPTAEAIRAELKRGLSALLDVTLPMVERPVAGGTVVVGTPGTSTEIAALGWDAALEKVGPDGHVLATGDIDGKSTIVVAATTEVGALYGAFHLLRILQTGGAIDGIKMVEKPAFKRRLLNHWDNLNRSVERGYAGQSIWKWDELPERVDSRYVDYARANASIGINGAVLNNVNASAKQLDTAHLEKAAAIANSLRPYGIRVYLTAKFSAPREIGGLRDANPSNPRVRQWWKDKTAEIYALIPDFGGFLVKANSEGQPGPQDYDKTHADGANMLAEALAPHGGVVMWRAFVYNSAKVDPDRVNRAHGEFAHFDGKFADNVFVQVKSGPLDFQPREPFNPLFGAMPKTPLMAELQITQEYKGHATHLVYLGEEWEEFFGSETGAGMSVADVLDGYGESGIAGVANIGSDANWTGHDFAQANWFAFGRLAWNPALSADVIAREWISMTWSRDPEVVAAIAAIMKGSWQTMIDYEMPLGLHHIAEGGPHYAPAPSRANKKNPDYSAEHYHRADQSGIGFDRTTGGSNAVSQYHPALRGKFNDIETCPEDLLLWFHHVPWDHRMKSGRTLWDELVFRYYRGVENVKSMARQWESLRGKVDDERFQAVSQRLEKHVRDATIWRDVCIEYFQEKSGHEMPKDLPGS